MMVLTYCGPDGTLLRTMAFRYIYGPGLILSTLDRANIRYPKLTLIDHAARRDNSRLPQFKSLSIRNSRRHQWRCCRTPEAANQGETDSSVRPGSDPVKITLHHHDPHPHATHCISRRSFNASTTNSTTS